MKKVVIVPSSGLTPGIHEWELSPRRLFICRNCNLRRLPVQAGWVFRTRKGTTTATEPRCRPRSPRHALAVLNMVTGAPAGGLTAAQLVAVLGHLPEAEVKVAIAVLARQRLLDELAAHRATGYRISAKGVAYVQREKWRAEKRPPGRPRKYAEGAPRPKRKYKSTGNPMGRPRMHPDEPRVHDGARWRPGPRQVFDDAKHVAARAASARHYSATHKRVVRLRDMTPEVREAYYERQRARACEVSRSWRRWATATRLADRHLAASPPEGDALSSYALEWLGRAA